MNAPNNFRTLKSRLSTSEWAIWLLYTVSLIGLLTGVTGIIPAAESFIYIPGSYLAGLLAISVLLFGITYYMNRSTKHLALKLEELKLD